MFTFFIVFECFHNPTALGPVWHAMRFPAMAVKCVFQVAYLSFFFHVNESFGFFAYKVVGADARLVRLFEWYRAFLSLLKIDLFCFLLLLLMAKLFVLDTEVVDFGLGIAGLAFSFVFAFVGWWAITHEMRWLTLLFLAASALQPAYVAYKLYILDVTPTLLPSNVTYTQFAVVGGVTLAIRILLLVITFQNMRTFGEGLKQRGTYKAKGRGDHEGARIDDARELARIDAQCWTKGRSTRRRRRGARRRRSSGRTRRARCCPPRETPTRVGCEKVVRERMVVCALRGLLIRRRVCGRE